MMKDPDIVMQETAHLKERYFSDENKKIFLKKGETLVTKHHFNDKLFLVLDGALSAYIMTGMEEKIELFRCYKNMFVGVYSFFSKDHISYSTVVAEQDSTLAYIDKSMHELGGEFAIDFLPVIIHEIYLRQTTAQKMTLERQAAIKKLYEAEKMTILGQMAAGIAHELNNAIGVLQSNTEWLSEQLTNTWHGDPNFHYFQESITNGQALSSKNVRERRKTLEQQYHISPKLAKKLAKANLSDEKIKALSKNNFAEADAAFRFIQTGVVLHDMNIAAAHAAHVVKSVRELGSKQRIGMVETSLSRTIDECLALLKKMLKPVQLTTIYDTDGKLMANPGDLVQVWLNLVKNACESMSHNKVKDPYIEIKIGEDQANYILSFTNNGPEIDPEILPRIFEPSFTTKVSGLSFGLGLGLSIVKKIIDSYEGTVAVNSQSGKTTFTVQLPKV